MLLLNMDRYSLFLACSDNEFHIFGSLKLTLFFKVFSFRKRVEYNLTLVNYNGAWAGFEIIKISFSLICEGPCS